MFFIQPKINVIHIFSATVKHRLIIDYYPNVFSYYNCASTRLANNKFIQIKLDDFAFRNIDGGGDRRSGQPPPPQHMNFYLKIVYHPVVSATLFTRSEMSM